MTASADTPPEVASPCVLACVIGQDHGFCLGCWRTLTEISHWHRYSTADKRDVLDQIEIRRAAIQTSN